MKCYLDCTPYALLIAAIYFLLKNIMFMRTVFQMQGRNITITKASRYFHHCWVTASPSLLTGTLLITS